ncbi:permease [Halobacteriovorax marinus]|uniref:Permease n=1 Tax=Halobacteriovorax marinus TaxID=97084 RepID=A0A1Y5FCJ4_9BACT|nr:permease [Halobacteriovorax marinus]
MEKFFDLKANGTTVKTELLAGVTTFLATAYIIVVNPSILSIAGLSYNGVLTATILVSFFSTLAMGLYAKNPIVLAPGMGINAFFTFSVVKGMNVSPEIALGAIFWSGVVFFIMSIFNIRELLTKAIPKNLRISISCGIGLFITLIGLVNAGVIIKHQATLITSAGFTPSVWVFFLGLLFTAFLFYKKVNGALLLGIISTALMSFTISMPPQFSQATNLSHFFAMPDFSLIGALDIKNSIGLGMLHVVFSLVFTDLFDSLSTFVAVSEAGNLKDEFGDPKNLRKSLLVDSFATLISGIFGTSSATSYIESAAGIEQGGRTGLVAVVCSFLFLPFLFLSPLLSLLTPLATAPTLVLVGFLMMRSVTKIDFDDISEGVPAFLSIVLIPLSYSINQGIIWGFLSYTILKIITGKAKEIHVGLYIIDALCLVSIFLS